MRKFFDILERKKYLPSSVRKYLFMGNGGNTSIEQTSRFLPTLQSEVKNKIVNIQGFNVIADADVADLYDVGTKRVNEAVRNNPEKFPEDYMFELTKDELSDLRSKFSTTKISAKSRVVPKVFTAKGLYMLATILKSKREQDVTFAIIETFAKVRYLTDIKKQTTKMQKFGEVISDIVMPDLGTSETESTLKLNFFIGKIKQISVGTNL